MTDDAELRERLIAAELAWHVGGGSLVVHDHDEAADKALAALGLNDLDAAAERSIDAWAHDYANDDWRDLSAEGQLAVARRVLEAALAPS